MQEEKKPSLKKRVSARYSMRAQIASRELIVIRGERCVTVYGCRRILVYSPTEIRLQLCRRLLSVTGEGLFCSCFSGGSITLEGKVSGLCFLSEDLLRQEKNEATR